METFFVSDTHFGHRNIISHCQRPFASVEEMDEALVENWNKTVHPNDTVYHLGDWAFSNYERIGQLNGCIHTVPGNHDHERLKKLQPYLTNILPEVHYLKVDRTLGFVLCHYPFETWRREYRYHLHGHTHGTGVPRENRLDVGVDATRLYRPINLDEVLTLIKE